MAKNDKKAPEAQVEETVESNDAEMPAPKKSSTEGLVKMHKDGTHLHVHPTTVKAHQDAGWKQA